MWLKCVCLTLGSPLLSQSSDEVLQRFGFFRLQQSVLLTEECEVCEESVEVWMQAQSECFSVVGPVNVSQSPEQQQEHLLDQKDKARRKH